MDIQFLFPIIYLFTAIFSVVIYLRKDNYKRPAGLCLLSTIYYTQNLFRGDAQAFDGLNSGVFPHWAIYIFYIALLIVISISLLSPSRSGLLRSGSVLFGLEKINFLRFTYSVQSCIFFCIMIIVFSLSGVDISNKNELIESKNIFFILCIFSFSSLVILSMISGGFKKFDVFLILIFLSSTFILGYRGVIVELCFVVFISTYFLGVNYWFTEKKNFFLLTVIAYIVLAPSKYFISMLHAYIRNGFFPNFDYNIFMQSMKNGNEGSSTMGILDIVMRSDISLPDGYFLYSIFQHIPFVREIFSLPRVSFNTFFQNQLFSEYNFGVGSSAVANMYMAGSIFGLLYLIVLLFVLLNFFPRNFYFRLMYLSVVPGYIFFFHRIDWDQILFSSSLFFYVSIFPFTISYILKFGKKFRSTESVY